MAEILLRNLYKAYNHKPVLRGISMDIRDGELVALVGPSGCGKTTTLKIMAGLLAPDRGEIIVNGRDITSLPPEKRDIVMVFQDNLLFPHLTVGENITFGLKMIGKSKRFRAARLRELLEIVQLPGLENRYPLQLSGGQQQRVALARALALEPEILLLDEPLSNLDPRLRDEMRCLISGVQKDLHMNMLLVTHDQDEAMLMADRIAVLFDGTLSQFDTPYRLYHRPATPEVANLFGPCNVLPGFLHGPVFQSGGVEFSVPDRGMAGEVQAYVRAEHIEVVEKTPDLTGIIKEVRYTRGHSLLKVAAGELELMVRTNDYFNRDTGRSVGLKVNWDRVYFQMS